MVIEDLAWWQWLVGGISAVLVGCAKTGVPGVGILVVPLMVVGFGGKPSVGLLLPILIFADCFAVFWYRRHTRWSELRKLFPWVIPGMILGTVVLATIGGFSLFGLTGKDLFKPLIGLVVLTMLVVLLIRRRMGESFAPQSRAGIAVVGGMSGLATTLANAAGPVMTLYLQGAGYQKDRFMGTNAWFFLVVNVAKVPIYFAVTLWAPGEAMFTADSWLFDLCMVPGILAGVFLGKWLFSRISERRFGMLVLFLAAVAAIYLLTEPVYRALR